MLQAVDWGKPGPGSALGSNGTWAQKKGRAEDGKGGKPAAPGWRTCGSGPKQPDQRKVGIATSVNFETR